jgi:hypothetical protein
MRKVGDVPTQGCILRTEKAISTKVFQGFASGGTIVIRPPLLMYVRRSLLFSSRLRRRSGSVTKASRRESFIWVQGLVRFATRDARAAPFLVIPIFSTNFTHRCYLLRGPHSPEPSQQVQVTIKLLEGVRSVPADVQCCHPNGPLVNLPKICLLTCFSIVTKSLSHDLAPEQPCDTEKVREKDVRLYRYRKIPHFVKEQQRLPLRLIRNPSWRHLALAQRRFWTSSDPRTHPDLLCSLASSSEQIPESDLPVSSLGKPSHQLSFSLRITS